MNAIITWLLAEAWPYIVAALGLVGGLFALRQSAKSEARREVEKQQTTEALDAIRRSNANREEVARMDDDAQLAEFDRLWAARRKKERR